MRRRLALLLLALCAAVPASAQARTPAIAVGIGDQKADMFHDARFGKLGIRYARFQLGWDSIENKKERRRLDAWLKAAKAQKVTPLITFGHSRLGSVRHHRVLPSVGRFTYEFTLLRKRYPWVRDFATWNEANYCGEPVCHHPALVAAYWRRIRVHCRTGCHVLAAELLDRPGMVGWAKAFIHAAHMQPGLWGLHNYSDANRKTTFNTRQLLRGVRGRIWLTETGGIVYRNNHSKYYFPQSAAHAARATTWLFTKVIPMSRRIERVYLYEWNATRSRAKWDTALIDAHGHARPAFKVLAKILAKMKPKPKVVVKPLPAPAPPPPTSTTPASPPPGG